MVTKIEIPFDPPLDGLVELHSRDQGIILAHGTRGDMDDGILPHLCKKLGEKNISTVRFRFPYRMKGKKHLDDVTTLDNAYVAVWQYITNKYPDKTWLVGGIDTGAETAIRATGLMMTDSGDIPHVISLNYPLYPPNRPEMVDASSLGAIMGDAIFIQASDSNQGTYDRLRNQLQMMVPHADMSKIRGANHDFTVDGKNPDRVAYWISNDIDRFIKNIFGA